MAISTGRSKATKCRKKAPWKEERHKPISRISTGIFIKNS